MGGFDYHDINYMRNYFTKHNFK